MLSTLKSVLQDETYHFLQDNMLCFLTQLLLLLQGLINLVGLTIAAPRPRGGFSYTHPPTGFVFEIVNDDSDSEDEAGSLVFNPLSFGSAEEVNSV